jgi:hypothetical protein
MGKRRSHFEPWHQQGGGTTPDSVPGSRPYKGGNREPNPARSEKHRRVDQLQRRQPAGRAPAPVRAIPGRQPASGPHGVPGLAAAQLQAVHRVAGGRPVGAAVAARPPGGAAPGPGAGAGTVFLPALRQRGVAGGLARTRRGRLPPIRADCGGCGTWFGWVLVRPGGPWQRVAEGRSLEACHRRLLQEARRPGLDGRPRVMTTGGYPDVPARQGGRHG